MKKKFLRSVVILILMAVVTGTLPITAFAENSNSENTKTPAMPSCRYQTHVQNVGWQDYVAEGEMSGTEGRSFRLEGIRIDLDPAGYDLGIQYQTHIQNIGWEVDVDGNGWKTANQFSGTEGRGYRLEAIQMKLTGADADRFDIYYQVHAQNIGWMNWAKDGELAGSAGLSYRLEGIRIKIVKKGTWVAKMPRYAAAYVEDPYQLPAVPDDMVTIVFQESDPKFVSGRGIYHRMVVRKGTIVTPPELPHSDDARFTALSWGFNTVPGGYIEYDFSKPVMYDETLYPGWSDYYGDDKIASYVFKYTDQSTYNTNYCTPHDSHYSYQTGAGGNEGWYEICINKGSIFEAIPNGRKEKDRTFLYWTLDDSDGIDEPFDFSQPVEGDKTFKAVYETADLNLINVYNDHGLRVDLSIANDDYTDWNCFVSNSSGHEYIVYLGGETGYKYQTMSSGIYVHPEDKDTVYKSFNTYWRTYDPSERASVDGLTLNLIIGDNTTHEYWYPTLHLSAETISQLNR